MIGKSNTIIAKLKQQSLISNKPFTDLLQERIHTFTLSLQVMVSTYFTVVAYPVNAREAEFVGAFEDNWIYHYMVTTCIIASFALGGSDGGACKDACAFTCGAMAEDGWWEVH